MSNSPRFSFPRYSSDKGMREREREREEEGRDGIWGCELTEEGKSNWNGEEWETEYFNSRNSDRITIV